MKPDLTQSKYQDCIICFEMLPNIFIRSCPYLALHLSASTRNFMPEDAQLTASESGLHTCTPLHRARNSEKLPTPEVCHYCQPVFPAGGSSGGKLMYTCTCFNGFIPLFCMNPSKLPFSHFLFNFFLLFQIKPRFIFMIDREINTL